MNLASLFNLAGPDLIIILLIVLLRFGVRNLPELGRGMGEAVRRLVEAMRELFKARDEFERESGESRKRAQPEDRFALLNRVLSFIVVMSALILLSVFSSRH